MVNRGQISIFHFITPKRHILARFRVFWAIKRQNPSIFLYVGPRKKIKSHKKLYFTALPRSPPWTDFYQIWNKHSTRGHNQPWRIVCQSVQGFRFYRGQIFHFPIGNWRRRYNSVALPRSLWLCLSLGGLRREETRGSVPGPSEGTSDPQTSVPPAKLLPSLPPTLIACSRHWTNEETDIKTLGKDNTVPWRRK